MRGQRSVAVEYHAAAGAYGIHTAQMFTVCLHDMDIVGMIAGALGLTNMNKRE
jgi:hypothetical protein